MGYRSRTTLWTRSRTGSNPGASLVATGGRTMLSRLIGTVRLAVVFVAIAVFVVVARYYRARGAWLAAAEANSIRGVPRIMSGPPIEEMVKTSQPRGTPADMGMFEP